MSGIVEDLREEVTSLQKALVKLCAKVGHEDEASSWLLCDTASHRLLPRGGDEDPTYYTDPRHKTKCQICGEFACEREEV